LPTIREIRSITGFSKDFAKPKSDPRAKGERAIERLPNCRPGQDLRDSD
jgi:hypothetical protein